MQCSQLVVCVVSSIQTAQGVICAAWDSAARQYVRIPSLDASRLPRLDWLRAQAQMCKVLGSGPVVYCLPLGPTAHSLRLVPRVQLPRHCYLRGWQPAGAEGGRSARVRAVSPAGPSQADSGLEVRVLARRHGGGYLPVSVRILTVHRAPEPQGTSCVLDLEASGRVRSELQHAAYTRLRTIEPCSQHVLETGRICMLCAGGRICVPAVTRRSQC